MTNAFITDAFIDTVRISWTCVIGVTLVFVTTFVTVTSVTFGTCTCVTFTGVDTDGVVATVGSTIVTFIWTTWCWCDWVCVTFALVFNLCKEAVPLGAYRVCTTATIGTLSIDDCLDLGHDWFVGIVAEVHEVTAYTDWTVALALIPVSVKVAVELVH